MKSASIYTHFAFKFISYLSQIVRPQLYAVDQSSMVSPNLKNSGHTLLLCEISLQQRETGPVLRQCDCHWARHFQTATGNWIRTLSNEPKKGDGGPKVRGPNGCWRKS